MKTYAHSIIRPTQKGLLITVAVLMSHQLHGQGTVKFSNLGLNSPVGTPCDANGFTPAPAGTTFSVALYFAPPDPANPNVQPNSAVFRQVGTSAFLVAPGTYDDGIRTAPITPPGGFGWFQVKAWESAFGTTYEQVAGTGTGLYGVSNIILIPTGNPTVTPATSPHPLIGISGISFFVDPPPPCVSEPSEVLFGLLAAATLCSLRHKDRTN